MPRKVARQRSYDIPFVGIGIAPVTLGMRETAAVTRALGRPPSREFKVAYRHMLANYDAHRKAVAGSSAAAVQRRIRDLVDSVKTLEKSLSNLQLTDRVLVGAIATARFLQNLGCTGLNELAEKLDHFLPLAEGALERVSREQKKGRMPAFAEQALACGLCQILFEETGKVPTTKPGDIFDRLLRLAFTQAGRAPRKDVVDLMRASLRETPEDRSLLSAFQSADETGTPTLRRGDTGTNKPE